MFKKVLVAATLILASNVSNAYEVNGLTLGKALDPKAVGQFTDVKCEQKTDRKVCDATTTYEGVQNQSIRYVTDLKNVVTLVQITIMDADVMPIENVLKSTYGDPVSVNDGLFHEMDWEDAQGNKIAYTRYKPTSAVFTFSSKDYTPPSM